MVNINLYRHKRPKFKITTILILTVILLVPVFAFRISVGNIKAKEAETIRGQSTYSSQLIDAEDLEASIDTLERENNNVLTKTGRLRKEKERIEKELVYANVSNTFIESLGEQYRRFRNVEKIFLDRMAINRGSDFTVRYYDIVENQIGTHNFTRELKNAYRQNGFSIEPDELTIDFLKVDILQTAITAKTSEY